MTEVILVPAYGRDYLTAKEAIKDYQDGMDFKIATVTHPYAGKYCSIRDFPQERVLIRFNKCQDFTYWPPRIK